jgi:hypothetical protein
LRGAFGANPLLTETAASSWHFVGVAPEAFYGVQFLELGTRHIPRRPWLEPAYRSQSREVVELFRKKLKQQIEKQAKQQVVG